MIIILSVLLVINSLFLASAIIHIKKIQQELIEIDKEQHNQNKDILELMKYRGESSAMLLQHTYVLEYLAEQDAIRNKNKYPIPSIVGEA
jgi:Na+-transporting NADH:ubiquinone oxidoreductase subunit NqrC